MAGSRRHTETRTPPATPPAGWWRSPALLALVGIGIVGAIILSESVVALAIVLMEGTVAVAVMASAGLAGGWIVRCIGLKDEPWPARLILGAGLGTGGLSLIVLMSAWAGVFTRAVALVLVGVLAVAGVARLVLDVRAAARAAGNVMRLEPFHWLWPAVCPFLAIALLAATVPPGILWSEEAGGYDVLEYHLAGPKAFYEAGRVFFMPNNVYTSFPLNSEMVSLLMMTLRGDPIEAAFMAQMANVAFAILLVAAAWLLGRQLSPLAGVIAGVLAATLPWVAYLAGIAYVESGMLAMGMCALAAMTRSADADDGRRLRWAVVAGLLAGLAAGFKYTAIPFIVLPVVLVPLFDRCSWNRRLGSVVAAVLTAAVAFAPWMIRNVVNTGNPVFPLAYSVFGAKAGTWDAELQDRWTPAHGIPRGEELFTEAMECTLDRIVGDFRMGPFIVALAGLGAATSRNRRTAAMLAVLVLQFAIWLLMTHRYARFAAVMLLPMIALAAQSAADIRAVFAARLACVLLILGAGWNLYGLGKQYYHDTRVSGRPIDAFGRTDVLQQSQHVGAINNLPASARVMLIGEARTFYLRRPAEYAVVFSHHPLASAWAELGDGQAVMNWLRERGVTHLLVHLSEIGRLRRTYGYEPGINAELFEQLAAAGLAEVEQFALPGSAAPYAVLYEVPSTTGSRPAPTTCTAPAHPPASNGSPATAVP